MLRSVKVLPLNLSLGKRESLNNKFNTREGLWCCYRINCKRHLKGLKKRIGCCVLLKEQNPGKVDRIINNLHRELFESYDCIACSNCCETIVPTVEEDEIKVISTQLKLTAAEFKSNYLIKTDEGYVMILVQKPPNFLD
jgi:hypothetical protein